MALTTAELNSHIRTIARDQLQAEAANRDVLLWWLRACVRHKRLGGADNIEAATTVAEFVFQQVIGRAPNAGDLHQLRRHLVTEADPTAEGELG